MSGASSKHPAWVASVALVLCAVPLHAPRDHPVDVGAPEDRADEPRRRRDEAVSMIPSASTKEDPKVEMDTITAE